MLFRIFTLLTVIALGIITWIQSNPARPPAEEGRGKQSERPGYFLRYTVLTDYDADGTPSVRIAAERDRYVADQPPEVRAAVRRGEGRPRTGGRQEDYRLGEVPQGRAHG